MNTAAKLKQQNLSVQQRLTQLKQKQLDENRARVILQANGMLKKISLKAKETVAATKIVKTIVNTQTSETYIQHN